MMKKMILLLLVMLFSFSVSASASSSSPETWYVGSVHVGGEHQLTVDVLNYGISNVSITLHKEGPSGQWTEVFYDAENLISNQMYTFTYNVGYLAPGNYKVVLVVNSTTAPMGSRLDNADIY
ncbi:hypothetical protein [Paenibacillus sp. L3-i20]|uniref:hypothetical protein n=1 Tax=Paenibacillus sp. L3-i20 TaxID=2905833 RepID=UPI001EE03696|nr:hypothetical protein [Paenibacillus sp. L3-i20]GKU75883.1 hypothetical protein L3i20_v202800 [Paenibacillus sp. L3-i20]